MAYQLNYWKYASDKSKPDDLDEVCPPRRIKRVADIHRIMRPIPRECDVITLDRTDKQSLHSREIWKRNGECVNI